MKYLETDFKNMMQTRVGSRGATQKELKSVENKLKKAHKKLTQLRETAQQGFMDLPYEAVTVRLVNKLAKDVKKNFDNLIVVGVGGADLGTRVINGALGHTGDGVNLYFAGSNTDPDTLSALLAEVDLKKTAINVVSKSGSTMETMSTFLILREALIKKVGKKKHTTHIYVTTDISKGTLQSIAEGEGYTIIPHPLNVGGRFSVLSTVGLFPAACAGISTAKILRGARQIDEHRGRGHRSNAAKFAALLYLGYKKRGQHIHVCMPYADGLEDFGFWFCQLWAESLGKSDEVGPTPIAALGATDQHSELQLYLEGPPNKIISLIKVKKFETDMVVPKTFKKYDALNYFSGKKVSVLNHAELEATAKALTKTDTPNTLLTIPKISPESLGALFMFFELACAYAGELFGVDTYNQPGVKLEKDTAKRILSSK